MKVSSRRDRPSAPHFLPMLCLVGSIVSLAIGTSLAKTLFPLIGAAGTTFLRVGFAAAIMLALQRPWRQPCDGRRARTIILYGALLGAMNLSFYQALRTIPFGIAVAIEFIGPLTLALLSSRRAIELVWVALAVAGIAVLLPIHTGMATASALDPQGIAFALGAGLCWMLYILVGQRLSGGHGGQAVAWGLVAAACCVAPFGAGHIGIALHDPRLLALALGVAILSGALPYSLDMAALRHLPRQTFGILLSLEPVVAALAAWILLGERLTVIQWAAITSVIVASAGSAVTANRAPRAAPPEATLP
ncbi:DMT family transporter [Robbsia sp. Bb-Pol-6]|uniref:DMT family transporter n=1 Tax=Robbsia betulipollinis TaxID=2981849 RepID=A0ABT3ZJ38_9BURK|nr:DMT family transporter [Robbsia betulipollinis]MCY0386534.1 DMT family transporter [Robbsia betulipollinis]